MTAVINSLKKARSGTATSKPTKQKAASSKTQVNKKPQPKKTKEQKKKTNDKWAWKSKPPRRQMAKKTTHSSRHLKERNIIGASTIITGRACGHCITPTIVRQAKPRRAHPPMPTLLPSTQWIAT